MAAGAGLSSRLPAAVLGAWTALALLGCVSEFERGALAGRPCPCLAGWVCDDSQGSPGVCVEPALGSGGSSGGSNPDARDGGGGENSEDGGGSNGADGGDTTGGSSGSGGSSGGGALECGVAATPVSADCPPECDECTDGTCHIRCDGDRSCSGTRPNPLVIACAPGMHCEVTCSSLDSCKAAEVQCSGAQSCSVLCTGERSCMDLRLACAAGPCELECGAGALVCKGSALSCGASSCHARCEGMERPRVEGCAASCSPACGC